MATVAPTSTGFQLDDEGLYIIKDPSALKDYTVNWEDWLNGETIAQINWTVDPGITVENQGNTPTTTFIELSGGEVGQAYVCAIHIETNLGREDEMSFRVVVREQ